MMGRYNVFSGEDVPYMNTNYARICIDATMYKPIHPILWFMSDQDFLTKPIHEAYSFIDIYCYYSIHCIFLGYNLVELSSIFFKAFPNPRNAKTARFGTRQAFAVLCTTQDLHPDRGLSSHSTGRPWVDAGSIVDVNMLRLGG